MILIGELPEVDAFIGTSQIGEILNAADAEYDAKLLTIRPIGNKTSNYLYDFDTPRLRATESHTASLRSQKAAIARARSALFPECVDRFGRDDLVRS